MNLWKIKPWVSSVREYTQLGTRDALFFNRSTLKKIADKYRISIDSNA